jgi:hypothetical protein
MTLTRAELASELLRDCPSESLTDHQRLADLIRDGASLDELLNTPEADRWPETYRWLKDNVPCPALTRLEDLSDGDLYVLTPEGEALVGTIDELQADPQAHGTIYRAIGESPDGYAEDSGARA